METAYFAAGCFWGVEAAFRKVDGVLSTAVGYSGGSIPNPSYELVCSDTTGHAEVVRVEYDPTRVNFDTLLATFWKSHNPTQRNRQGPDIGTQYRSAIFYINEEQRIAAEKSLQQLAQSGVYRENIVTEISSAAPFYLAEEYHQQYLEKKGLASCGF